MKRRLTGWLCSRQRALAIVWAAVTMPLLLSFVGLVIDGSILFDARRDLQNVADGAARAGAGELDQQTLRQSAGATVVLEGGKATQAAHDYVSGQNGTLQSDITVQPQQVTV